MNIASKTVCASVLFLLAFTLMFTLSSHNVHASPVVLPIINQNEFQACFLGWCQTVAPAFLFTDLNLTTSTITYNISNTTINNITNITNYNGANVSSITCGGTDKVSAIDNATGEVTCSADQTGEAGGEPLWEGNYSSNLYYNGTGMEEYFYNYTYQNGTGDLVWKIMPIINSFTTIYSESSSIAESSGFSTYAYYLVNISNTSQKWSYSYFYPYLNPFNFINSSFNATYDEYAYNQTTPAMDYADDTFITLVNEGNLNTNSSVYCSYIDNSTERNLFTVSNMTVTANLNVSFYNTTYYLSSASVPTCSKYYNVSTLLWCDCFNTTHKWMANTC